MLSSQEHDRVVAAIRKAEGNTAGEIVVVLARQASTYRSVTLVYALLGALLTPWPLIVLTELSASRIFLVQVVVALLLSLLFLWPTPWRVRLVPRFVTRARAREASAREFQARGLAGTQGRTGILIYVAAAERYAEVVADTGISSRVPDEVWRETIVDLVGALGRGEVGSGLEAAVARVGAILAQHAPARPGDPDELPNRVILI